MQTSARKFSLRTPRFDSNTGRRRGFWYSWRALAAGLALALLAGSGIAVAAVGSSADAHNHKISVSCAGITVHGDSYQVKNDDATPNTVTVTIGNAPTQVIKFGQSYDNFFPFLNAATAATVYSAQIKGYDPGYQEDANGTSQPCPTPQIALTAPTCTTANGTISLGASITSLDNSHAYTIELTSTESGATTSPATGLTVAGGASSKSWTVVPGHNYTVTVVDTTVLPIVLTATKSVLSVGCPVTPGVSIAGTECTTPTGSGTFTLTATDLSFGRAYTIALYTSPGNVVVTSVPATGDLTGKVVVSLASPAGGTYYATITDDLTTVVKTSGTLSFLPCPQVPAVPQIDPTECTSTNGTPNSSITFSASGLVPNRFYQVTVSNGTTNVFDSGKFQAASSTFAQQTKAVPPGTYTVTIADVTDLALTTFVKSNSTTIGDCPLMPNLAFTPTQCTVPGGTASIVTTITNFVPGRAYLIGVTLVQGGTQVVAPASVTAPGAAPWVLPAFANLAPGTQYRITVTDSVVTSVSASGDVSLNVCPGMPTVTVQATCNILGASTANVNLDKLEATQTYTVTVTKLSNNTVIGTQTVPGTTPTVALQFKNVPNGNQYMVNVANANNTLTGSASFFLKICDLPTLAFTGANPVGPAVAGLGFLQLGLILVGLNLAVRRRRTA